MYGLDGLAATAAADALVGVTPENIRARARVPLGPGRFRAPQLLPLPQGVELPLGLLRARPETVALEQGILNPRLRFGAQRLNLLLARRERGASVR